jgi:two-component system chemotaxis response regulator CheY
MGCIKILLAEDDAVTRASLKRLLGNWGYDVTTAANGEEAWRLLQENGDLRLVLLDWMMPGKDGIEICRLIRQIQPASNYVYTIFLTARGNKEDALEGLQAGADDYITKPFHSQELRFRLKIGERILELEGRLRAAYEEMRRLATFDALTSLWNRRMVLERFEEGWTQAKAEDRTMSIILADIDGFKHFNDTHGHAVGDRVLIHAARVFHAGIRPHDGLGRYGGEEFLFFLTDCDETVGHQIAERLRKQLASSPLQEEGRTLYITASFGGATVDPAVSPGGIDEMLKAADRALYRAKNKGRNRVEWLCQQGDTRAPP